MSTIPFTTAQGNYLAVEVPEDTDDVSKIYSDHLKYWIGDKYGFISIPAGTWSIVGLLSDITESRADSIVDTFGTDLGTVFKEYGTDRRVVNTALESFASLCKAHGIDSTKNYIILKEKI